MHGGQREEEQGMKETVEEKGEETVFGLGFRFGRFGVLFCVYGLFVFVFCPFVFSLFGAVFVCFGFSFGFFVFSLFLWCFCDVRIEPRKRRLTWPFQTVPSTSSLAPES